MARKLAVQTVFNALDHVTGPMASMGRNVERYSQRAERAGRMIGASWSRMRGLIVGATSLMTTGFAAKALVDFSSMGDEIAKTARMLGLSAKSLQELRFAADRGGVSAENLTMAFRLLNNNTGQLRAGQGALYSYLKLVNPQLALQAKRTTNTEEAFLLLIDAIGKESNSAKRAALAQAAFGRSGQELIKLAAAGGDGIKKLREEAQRLGLVMNDETAKASEDMNDAITDLKASVRGLTNNALGPLIKRLGPLIERVAQWIAANKEIIGQRIDRTIDKIVKAVTTAITIWKKWHPVIIAVGAAMILFSKAAQINLIIMALSKAIAVCSAVMVMFQSGASLATVAQWALNAAMDANPVGAVIIALTALVAVVILIIRYWKEITNALRESWNWFNKIYNNPFVRMIGSILLYPLIAIASIIQTIVDLISGKGISSLKNLVNAAGPLYSIAKSISDLLGITTSTGGEWEKPIQNYEGSSIHDLARKTPLSSNTGVIASNVSTTRRSVLDVNLAGVPPGSTARQRGEAPDINVNMGPTMEWGMAGL